MILRRHLSSPQNTPAKPGLTGHVLGVHCFVPIATGASSQELTSRPGLIKLLDRCGSRTRECPASIQRAPVVVAVLRALSNLKKPHRANVLPRGVVQRILTAMVPRRGPSTMAANSRALAVAMAARSSDHVSKKPMRFVGRPASPAGGGTTLASGLGGPAAPSSVSTRHLLKHAWFQPASDAGRRLTLVTP